jgi:hypothetical protein
MKKVAVIFGMLVMLLSLGVVVWAGADSVLPSATSHDLVATEPFIQWYRAQAKDQLMDGWPNDAAYREYLAEKYGGPGILYTLGRYNDGPMDAASEISWIVVYEENNVALLMSFKIIELHSYSEDTEMEWMQSDLQHFLNNEFYENAFSEMDKRAILPTDRGNVGVSKPSVSNKVEETERAITTAIRMPLSIAHFCVTKFVVSADERMQDGIHRNHAAEKAAATAA